jgi:hypothetical protein
MDQIDVAANGPPERDADYALTALGRAPGLWGFTDVHSQQGGAKCAREDGHTCVGA